MNLKQIKDLARQAFRDQQLQDNEGGVPCSVSFITGFVEGYLKGNKIEIEELKTKVEDLEAANHILKQALKYANKTLEPYSKDIK
jgi:hypothetical protein